MYTMTSGKIRRELTSGGEGFSVDSKAFANLKGNSRKVCRSDTINSLFTERENGRSTA